MDKQGKKALVPRLRFPEFLADGEWERKTLADVCQRITNGKANAEDHEEDGLYPLFDRSEVIKRSNDFAFNDEAVIIPGEGMRFQPKYYQGKFNLHQRAYALMLHKGDARFVYYTLDRFKERLAKNAVKSTVLSLRLPIIENFSLTVPGKDEQKKISDCLTSLDEVISAENQKLETLKTYKKGLMQQLFPREGETVPRLRFPEFKNAADWKRKPLSQVCEVLQGYGFPEALQGRSEGKYPFCKVSDISRAVAENGGVLASATNYVGDVELSKLKAKLIPVGAVVFAKIGEALRLNRRAFVQNECLIDNNAVGLKAILGRADDYFIYLLSQLIDLNKHCGGAVPSVNKSTLEAIEVFVPEPSEQKRIAKSLFSLDELITAQGQKINALKDHKKGLMQQLFPVLDEVPA